MRDMRFRGGVVVLAAALALGAGWAVPASASASDWTVRQVPDGTVRTTLFSVSCPSESLCVAGGSNLTIASSRKPTGDASAWKAVHPGPHTDPNAASNLVIPGNAITGISCPSPNFCVATGPQGDFFVSTDPTGPASAWRLVELGLEATHMQGISCPTASFCVAVGYNGKVVHSTDPGGDASAWAVTKLPEPLDLRGVSCATPSLCAAVDNTGHLIASSAPTMGAGAWSAAFRPAGEGHMNGISCPSPLLCVTGNPGMIVTSTNPTGGAPSWRSVNAGTGLPIKGVSCPTASACAAVDNNADVLTSLEPTGGPDAWSFVNVIRGPDPDSRVLRTNGMFGISCPAKSLCVAVGQERQVIASTNPFERDAIRVPIRGGRRPHVRITRHPPKRLEPRKGGRRALFAFRAIGSASRFRCKLDRRRFSRCKSPVRYRVGRGKHVFKAFAIGPTGLRGPRATFHFRVGALTERPPVGTCRPGQEGSVQGPCIPPR